MEKIKIKDKEYNCINKVYYYILGLESENRLFKLEINSHETKEIMLQQKIDRAREFIKENIGIPVSRDFYDNKLLEILGDKENE